MSSDMQIEWVSTESLKPNAKNRNRHPKEQIERLAKIIKANGWRHPIIVSKLSGKVVVGHGRLEAAKLLSEPKVPVHFQDFANETEEYQFGIADNAIASWAELDLAGINTDLPAFGPELDVDLLGIKDFELEPADKYGDKDADDTPMVRNTDIVAGDLFSLGSHRLLCGDSTNSIHVERLMNGEKADMVFTDPPYGMNLDTDYSSMGKSDHNYSKIIGDNTDFQPGHIFEMFGYCKEVFLFGADYYCERLPEKNSGSWVVWDKRQSDRLDIPTTLDNSFGSCFELVWSKSKHKRDIARFLWCAGLGEGKEEERVGRNNSPKRVHPTQKPIDLCCWFFERWGKDAKLIVDLYLGSGSTLIACEKTNRKCYGMEISPEYVQVCIDRWEKFTGQKAVKISTGVA